jgi:hypothetical protein
LNQKIAAAYSSSDPHFAFNQKFTIHDRDSPISAVANHFAFLESVTKKSQMVTQRGIGFGPRQAVKNGCGRARHQTLPGSFLNRFCQLRVVKSKNQQGSPHSPVDGVSRLQVTFDTNLGVALNYTGSKTAKFPDSRIQPVRVNSRDYQAGISH